MGHPETTPVETLDLETFFAPATQPQDWHGDEERAIAHRFQDLVHLLQTHLKAIQVYRLGSIEIPVYIVGQDEAGDWIIVSTTVVET